LKYLFKPPLRHLFNGSSRYSRSNRVKRDSIRLLGSSGIKSSRRARIDPSSAKIGYLSYNYLINSRKVFIRRIKVNFNPLTFR
jgi:hypothetical protein